MTESTDPEATDEATRRVAEDDAKAVQGGSHADPRGRADCGRARGRTRVADGYEDAIERAKGQAMEIEPDR